MAKKPKSDETKSPKAPPILHGAPILTILDDLARHTDREAAIVGGGLIEALLKGAIRSHFVSEDDHDRVFRPGQALGNLHSMIYVSYLFGVIPKGLRVDLQNIADIRNRFAHDFEPWTFDSAAPEFNIRSECQRLSLPEKYQEYARWLTEKHGHRMEETDDGVQEITLQDDQGYIGAAARVTPQDLSTSKGRFLTSIRLAWVLLLLVGRQPPSLQDISSE